MNRRMRSAFTLIELLVVIGILMVLAALIAPAVAAAREAARASLCRSRLSELALAAHQYEGVFGCLPRSSYSQHPNIGTFFLQHHQYTGPSIHLQLLPYIEPSLADAVNWQVPIPSDVYSGDETRPH